MWTSLGSGEVKFSENVDLDQIVTAFEDPNQKIDGNNVKIEIKDSRTILISNLRAITDEIYLVGIFQQYGPVEEINLKKHIEREKHEKYEIGAIKFLFENVSDDKINVNCLKRKRGGLRTTRLKFRNIMSLSHAYQELNGGIGKLGTGRVHLRPYLTYSFKLSGKEKEIIDHKMDQDQVVKDYISNKNIKLKTEILEDEDDDIGGKCVLQLICHDVNLFVNIKDRLWNYLEGKIVTLQGFLYKKIN